MNTRQIKEQISIIDYLAQKGIQAAKEGVNSYLYKCPWREDIHPSLSVTKDGKGWHDFSTGESGNIIDLSMKILNTKDLKEVCAEFENFSFISQITRCAPADGEKKKDNPFASFGIVDLSNKALLEYANNRGISQGVIKTYCKEAHYSFSGANNLFSIAFQNDKGGWELRNASYKGGSCPKWITTHKSESNKSVAVFEGFMDFLSFCEMYYRNGLPGTANYCVLNSIVNVDKAIDFLSSFEIVYLYLDNDQAGSDATNTIRESLGNGVIVRDERNTYTGSKDFNDFLLSRKGLGIYRKPQ